MAAPSAVVGLLGVPAGGVLGMVAAVAACTWVVYHLREEGPSKAPSGRRRATTLLVAAGGLLAVLGLVRLLGQTGVLLAVGLAATSPPAVSRVLVSAHAAWRRLMPPPRPAPTTIGPAGPAVGAAAGATVPSPQMLTDAELCLAWRSSFVALANCSDLATRIRLADLRQHYLDELERRNPRGFARWLYAGARPGSDPSRYLAMPRRQVVQPEPGI